MKTISEILLLSQDYLTKQGIQQPRRQAEDLLCDALKLERINLYTQFDRPLTEAELNLCRDRLIRRGKGEPLQYINGEVQFYGCTIKVNPSVLIPRQETEILVDKIVKMLSKEDLKGKILFDLCCGSGCIGIAIKKKLPDLQVILSDISPQAVSIAKENAANNHVDIEVRQGDLLSPFQEKADFAVCNPPYIAERELNTLDREVREYEPHLALISGSTGFEIYQRLERELPRSLNPGARVAFEIGKGQGEPLLRLFSTPPWTKQHVEADWAGHDRFFFLEIERTL